MSTIVGDAEFVGRLRAGDESAFRQLVTTHHASMVRIAESFVPSRAIAEEVVQDTWLAVMNGIGRFEGRSSLRTWIFRILTNRAKDRGVREARSIPESSLGAELDDDSGVVGVERFMGKSGRGKWGQPLVRWSEQPTERFVARETFDVLERTIATLPENQRRVLVLRDVEGWTSDDVRELLDVSEVNQRVLLHRARGKVREALERRIGEGSES